MPGEPTPVTLVELLRLRALRQPDRTAYTFLSDGEREEATLTYGQLDARARAVGARLQEAGAEGGRVLLLFPPGLDYVSAFFGCLYAGAVAVPTYPPRPNRKLERLRGIVEDAGAAVALTTERLAADVEPLLRGEAGAGRAVSWLAADEVGDEAAGGWRPPELTGDSLALLQYTSGSTSSPRGVMVSHGNLLHNESMLGGAFGQSERSLIVGWLPLYHDMGLIGNVIQPLFAGAPCVLMSPLAFLQRPLRWLEAISRYRATTSGGPDFAYELCTRVAGGGQRAGLDLSCWEVAFNGSEPVRAETLERFSDAFAPYGFRREAFRPCYGLAEATLFVSGGPAGASPSILSVRKSALSRGEVSVAAAVGDEEGEDGDAQRLVGCGRPLAGHDLRVVNPETLNACRQGEVGEIWLSGPSVGAGYWNRPAETEEVFGARLSGGEGPYLRTGDLGFLLGGELFVAGRLKDLVIIRGRNYYPHDIELTAERSHPALAPHGGAAFSVEGEGGERLVVVHEVERGAAAEAAGEALAAVRRAVAEEHEVEPHAVVLIRRGGLPKTSSGKVRRRACRELYLSGGLRVLAEWKAAAPARDDSAAAPAAGPLRDPEELEERLRRGLAARLRVEPESIDAGLPVSHYGLDSLTAIDLIHRVEVEMGVVLPLEALLGGASLRQLAASAWRPPDEGEASRPPDLVNEPTTRPKADDEGGELPLSRGQQALWFLHQLAPESAAYNISSAVRVLSPLDPSALRRAWQALVDRHPALRTNFASRGGTPFQRVRPAAEVYFREVEAETWTQGELTERLVAEAGRPFDLERDSLLRVHLYRRPGGEHVLLLVVHHIIADSWSLALLVGELGTLYRTAAGGGELPAPEGALLRYADYVNRQEEVLAGPEGERLWDYWRSRLAGELPLLDLPAAGPRPPVQTYAGASEPFTVGGELTAKLKAVGRSLDATLYMTLLAAFEVLLHRYTGQDDFAVGTPTAGRSRAGLADLVGYFVNPVVMRADLSGDPTFAEHLARVRRTVLGAFAHQDYPFALLVERLQPSRDPSRSPLFQVMFTLHQERLSGGPGLAPFGLGETGARAELGGLCVESLALRQRVAQFDLTLVVAEAGEELSASLQYNTDLFDAAAVARMAGHFQALLHAIAADPAGRVTSLPMLTEQERYQLLREWNDTEAAYPQGACVHRLFEEQARRTPSATSLVCGGDELTYRELDERANRLANRLRRMGVGPEVRVGLMTERSTEMMVGLLAILKAGGAYVPLDPEYPRERLAWMVEDSRAAVLLTEQRYERTLPAARGLRVLCLDLELADILREEAADAPDPEVGAENLAYVIYTSGSTGKPKGATISHRNVLNFFAGMDEALGYDGPGTWLAVTSISFDISVLELFWTLARGFKVVLHRESARHAAQASAVQPAASGRPVDFSLFYFATDDGQAGEDKYRLLVEGAKFADRHGFAAVWTPERHFHQFGGLYPNPAVVGAALAALTERVQIRAGSVVLPLHHPARVAEDWAVVDNLSRGRVALSFASGWHADDFVFAPEAYADRKERTLRDLETVRRLWRGETVGFPGGAGGEVTVRTYPRPYRAELPVWLTAAGSPETFRAAGEIGANLLTHLLGQSLEELAEKIGVYRRAWRGEGAGVVTLMLHTFVGASVEEVREKVRRPFGDYLLSSYGLMKNLARSLGRDTEGEGFTDDDREALLDFAFDRYFETSGLFGTPETCLETVERLKALGVDELACLIDFGVDEESVMEGLRYLSLVRERSHRPAAPGREDYSVAAQIVAHGVTHFQCTPSMANMLAADPETLDALRSVRKLLLGGEALPASLARQLTAELPAEIYNMYGPTETTIWSSTDRVGADGGAVTVGRPVANTSLHVLGRGLQPAPVGVAGELFIGGHGVVRGYLNRPGLTADRFVPDPFSAEPGARLYRTGDLARRLPDGRIEFIGRVDHQVKLRGHRVELGEIEALLAQQPGVHDCVVVAREDAPGDRRLVAYVVLAQGATGLPRELAPAEVERLLGDRRAYRLPNGLVVAHHTGLQTSIIYREIFEDEVYLRHGVALRDGDCVFDVGANIGLFTLFVYQRCPGARVFAFEPIPPTFELLKTNAALYGLDARLFECGLASAPGEAEFTFYRRAAGLSGRTAYAGDDRRVTESVIRSWLGRVRPDAGVLPSEELEALVEEELRGETYTCQLDTISGVMRRQGVERIDLLKVDVEGGELDVLAGVGAEDWKRIRQVVVEVSDGATLGRITSLLEGHGFRVAADSTVVVEERADGRSSYVYTLYATHPAREEEAQTREAASPAAAAAPARLSVEEMRAALQEKLPAFMVPSAFVVLDALPLTPNGKVNRNALPRPAAERPAGAGQAPRTQTERELAAIWSEVLGAGPAGIDDDFFEVGGHSLTATQMVSRVRAAFAVPLTLRGFLKSPTVRSLAGAVEDTLIERADAARVDELLDWLEELEEDEAEAACARDLAAG